MTDLTMLNIQVNQQLSSDSLEMPVAATEEDSVLLAEKLTQVAIPLEVLLEALTIATYDKVAAFHYADQYLNKIKKSKRVILKSLSRVRQRNFHKNN